MANPKPQGRELHQLKLKLTKDPRTANFKIQTPTKQHQSKSGCVSSPDCPKAPSTKVLKLSEVLSMPVTTPIPLTIPTKPVSKGATVVTQHSSAAPRPQTVKSPKPQQQRIFASEPVVIVKSPRKKQTVVVSPPQQKQQIKQQLSSSGPVVVKSPKSRQSMVTASGEVSSKHKPPPLKLMEAQPESKKQQSILPNSRVRTIMKTNIKSSTSDGPLNVGQDSVAIISKATEMFIAELMKGSHKTALECCHKEITYGHLAKTVRKEPNQHKFLFEILPEKVLVRDYLASLNSHDQDRSPKSTH